MSQPYSRRCDVPAPAQLDPKLDEFWFTNPWYIQNSRNLSAFERNRLVLNLHSMPPGSGPGPRPRMADISFISGTDSDGDGRSVVCADFRNDGRLDLVVRQTGGGPLILYENRFAHGNWLTVSLRGVQSNRLGIGAKVTVHTGDKPIVREVYPANSFRSQAPCRLHFGLGDENQVKRLTIRWPSGLEQSLDGVTANQHLVIEEGMGLSQAGR